jgi:EndoU nuclease-like protein
VALDRTSYEAGDLTHGSVRDVRPEGAGGDVPVRQSGSVESAQRAESLTRAEYYEVRRAADAGAPEGAADKGSDRASDRASGGADAGSDRGGWDQVEAGDRPPAEEIRVSPERTTHILDGDSTGGGHRHGVGKPPGKTEFPASWDDKRIMDNVLDVARHPDCTPTLQHRNDRWICTGTRDDVEISVIVLRSGEAWTSWPEEDGPGVVRNPRRGRS